jgi:hypothetical protein
MSGWPAACEGKGVPRINKQMAGRRAASISGPVFQYRCFKSIILLTQIPGKGNEEKADPYAGKAQPPEDTGRQAGKFDHHPLDSLRTEKIGQTLKNKGQTQGSDKNVELEVHFEVYSLRFTVYSYG